jgi:uncharacterized RDD family membrane protein YckC
VRLTNEAQAWLTQKVHALMQPHHLEEAQRSSIHYEVMSHLHAAGEEKARMASRDEVSVGDLQAALLDMGGEQGVAQAFIAPHAKPLARGGIVARAAALVVDYIVVAVGLMAAMFFLALTGFFIFAFSGFRGNALFFDGPPGEEVAFPLMWLLSLAYFVFFEGRDGRTFGKQVFNLRVRRANGGPVTYREALIRNAVKVFPPLLFLDVLFLLLFFQDEKQRVSDRLADTVVVEAR